MMLMVPSRSKQDEAVEVKECQGSRRRWELDNEGEKDHILGFLANANRKIVCSDPMIRLVLRIIV